MLAMGSDDFENNIFTLKSYHLAGIGVAGCSCSAVSQGAPCLAPSRTALIPVDASPPSAHTCPDRAAQLLDCSCSKRSLGLCLNFD
jgi:hypothetical protein